MKVVIINCFETYENRVELLQDYFEKTASSVTVYTSDYCHFQKCRRESAPDNFELISTKPYKKNLSFARLASHADFSKKVREALEEKADQIDLLWVMLPPNSLAKQMAEFKKRHMNICLVFDIIDMWPETMPLPYAEHIWPLNAWGKLRNKNLTYADIVTTECKLYQEKIKDYVKEEQLFNLYFAKKVDFLVQPIKPEKNMWELCYLGSINNIIDIDLIGKIIEQLSKNRTVRLHVIGDGERKNELLETARLAGAQVQYHGIVFDNFEKGKILSQCHFGLNIMKDSVYVGLTMKSMDYFAFGLPMINNIKGDTLEIIAQNEFGVNYPFDEKRLVEISNQEDIRDRMRAYYHANFSVEAFDRALLKIMEKLDAYRN